MDYNEQLQEASSRIGIDPLDEGIHVENTIGDRSGAEIHTLKPDEATITPAGTPRVLGYPDVCRGLAALSRGGVGGCIPSQFDSGARHVDILLGCCSATEGFRHRLVTNKRHCVIDTGSTPEGSCRTANGINS